jgi:phosphatidylglycerol:prolipoprotein diacylglycerol transferase
MLLYWNFDPVLLSLGPISVRWYGLLFLGAFVGGELVLIRLFKSEGVVEHNAERLLTFALIGTIIGARLAHCLFYEPNYYLAHPMAILRIWEGGLASHGGVVGMLVGLWIGHRYMRPRPGFLWLLDRVTIPAALGAVLVRVANFLNSEIVGVPTSGKWGVVFEVVDQTPRHPAQLYEAAGYFIVFIALLTAWRRMGRNTPLGFLLGTFMVSVFMLRILAESFKVPQAAYEAGLVFTVGQMLSLPFVLLGVVILVRSLK